MIGAAIIVFREMIEAGLIVGIVLAATQHAPHSRMWIVAGIAAGIAGSMVVASLTGFIAGAFDGFGQELLNAAILGTAVIMLTWHNVWMAVHGRTLAAELAQTSRSVIEQHRSLAVLAVVVGLAVLREGSEVVLFLYSVAVSNHSTQGGMLAGGALGILLGGGVSFLTYRGLLSIPTRYFFAVTTWLITFLTAGMAGQCVAYLEKAGAVNVLQQTVWNTSGFLPESSKVGVILHTLIGYSDQPTLLQLIAYLGTLAVIVTLMRLVQPLARKPAAAPAE